MTHEFTDAQVKTMIESWWRKLSPQQKEEHVRWTRTLVEVREHELQPGTPRPK